MSLFKRYAAVENDPGERFVFGHDPDSGTEVALRVRKIPPAEERAIEARYLGKKRELSYSGGAAIIRIDSERQVEAAREKAVLALVDTEGVFVALGDQASVDAYVGASPALGDVSVGESVRLDGRWTPELKRLFFTDAPELAGWVLEKAAALGRIAREDEAGKGETS